MLWLLLSASLVLQPSSPRPCAPPVDCPGVERPVYVRISVGQTAKVRVMYAHPFRICDDLKIVKVEDEYNYVKFTGLKPGRTACGFFSEIGDHRPCIYVKIEVTKR
jgi:hypothetical protein